MKEIKQHELNDYMQGKVVLEFFGAGCINCKMIEPILDGLVPEYPGVTFLKMDTAKAPEMVREFGITTLPTVVFMRDGVTIDKFIGLKPKALLQKKIDEVFEGK